MPRAAANRGSEGVFYVRYDDDAPVRPEAVASLGSPVVLSREFREPEPSFWNTLATAGTTVSPLVFDLLNLARALFVADCQVRRPGGANEWARRIVVTIPVRELATWQRPAVAEALARVLALSTGDVWEVRFVAYDGPPFS